MDRSCRRRNRRHLLRQAVDGAQAPDQLRAVDADHLVLWQVPLEDLECPAVVPAVPVGGDEQGAVDEVEVHVRGGEPLAVVLDDAPDPARYGDEPSLMRRRTGVEVAVGRDRAEAATLLVRRGANVIIADDGLQNPSLARDIEICVIDGQRRFGNEQLLPAGPLREPLSRLETMDFRICNGARAERGEIPMRLAGEVAVSVASASRTRALASFARQRIHAVAAIGNPGRFFTGLQARGIEVIAHPFPDHHAFVAGDIAFADTLPVLMTEKDAIKCVAFAGPDVWCVPVSADVPATFIDELVARLRVVRLQT